MTPVISLKNVLVATDFGDSAASALAYGRQLTRTFAATLHVVHVVEDISGRLSGLPNAPEAYIDFGRWQREAVAAGQEEFDKLLTDEYRRKL